MSLDKAAVGASAHFQGEGGKAAVRAIAELARIEVPDADLDHLAGELSGILHFVEQLAEVDTDGIAPMSSVLSTHWQNPASGGVADMTLPLRKDAVTDGGQADAVLANAPDAAEGFFTVPKVVE